MVLMAIVGGLGSGKTLSATWVGMRNYIDGQKIYSNYWLNKKYIKYTPVKTIDQIENLREGTFLGDELWAWLDARESGKKKNKIISGILLKSRKRGYDIVYTVQHFSQMDKRVRKVTDFIAYPQLNKTETWCTLSVYDRITGQLIQRYKFPTAFIFQLYNTNEEIDDVEVEKDD